MIFQNLIHYAIFRHAEGRGHLDQHKPMSPSTDGSAGNSPVESPTDNKTPARTHQSGGDDSDEVYNYPCSPRDDERLGIHEGELPSDEEENIDEIIREVDIGGRHERR